MNVIYVHGSFGHPEEHWVPWLATELKKRGHAFIAPKFPRPPKQLLENWLTTFEEYQKHIHENTILVGHNLGPAFILRLLEESERPVRGAVLVSPCVDKIGVPRFDMVNDSFTRKAYNWNRIRQNCKEFTLIHGSDDPYIPINHATALQQALGAKLRIIRGGKHLNDSAGYSELPQVLESILELTQ